MIIQNATVLTDDYVFRKTDLAVSGGKILEIGTDFAKEDVLSAENCYVLPGFIDSHMHGAMAETFYAPGSQTVQKITSFEAKNGTTTIIPALSAAKTDYLIDCISKLKEAVNKPLEGCANIAGIHLEGPYFSPKYRGAHLPENLCNPTLENFKRLYAAAGDSLKILTLAPELPGAEEVVRFAAEKGVRVSAGHTNASAAEIKQAGTWGVTRGTHLFNAMRPLNHREPGTVGALLYGDFHCEIIADFVHIHPDVVSLAYRLKGADGLTLITDSELAAGMPDGDYFINGRRYTVCDGKTLTDDGAIAGGSACLFTCFKNLVSLGVPVEKAVKTVTENPARAAGIFEKTGSITPGKTADLLILDSALTLKHVILRGQLLY